MTPDLRAYAEREFDIIAAAWRGLLAPAEYRECRMMAYFAHGYLDAARRSVARLRGLA